jgi:hypothetical protein
MGVDTAAKREVRRGYLRGQDLERAPLEGADGWLNGKKGQWEWVEKE